VDSVTTVILVISFAGTLAGIASVMLGARRTGVVPMPSSRSLRRLVTDVLREYAEVPTVVDLGSGWGGLARRVARSLPQRRVVAIEHSRVPLLVSRMVSGRVYSNLEHNRADIYELPLSGGTAYVCYLSGPGMRRLRESFERELPRGGLLLSAAFAVPGWTPARVFHARDLFRTPLYIYEF
jgi:hypothetical protein